jgi:hypothetical protein
MSSKNLKLIVHGEDMVFSTDSGPKGAENGNIEGKRTEHAEKDAFRRVTGVQLLVARDTENNESEREMIFFIPHTFICTESARARGVNLQAA